MYQFLCFVGPGAVVWLVGSQHKEERAGQSGACFLEVFKVIAYAFVDMAVTVGLLRPFGRIAFSVMEDGVTGLQYGATGIMVSMAVAVLLGFGISVSRNK